MTMTNERARELVAELDSAPAPLQPATGSQRTERRLRLASTLGWSFGLVCAIGGCIALSNVAHSGTSLQLYASVATLPVGMSLAAGAACVDGWLEGTERVNALALSMGLDLEGDTP